MKKLDYVNALRGIAILAVLMVHTSLYGTAGVPYFLVKVFVQGARGVQLFFLISAFTLFLSHHHRQGKESSPTKNFFLRRFFRIAPMYYLGIAYYIWQDRLGSRYWLGDQPKITVSNIISNLTFTHGFNPYWFNSLVPGGWSIAVEMTFYFILPFLFLKIKNINQAFFFFMLTLVINFGFQKFLLKFPFIISAELWYNYIFMFFPSQLPIFSLGIIMYFFIMDKNVKILSANMLLLFSLTVLAQLAVGNNYLLPNHILFGTVFLTFSIALSRQKFKFIVNPIINYIGKISFSMYLVHFAVLHWMAHFNFINYVNNGLVNYILRYLIVLVISILISTFLYHFIEINGQLIGSAIIRNQELKYKNGSSILKIS